MKRDFKQVTSRVDPPFWYWSPLATGSDKDGKGSSTASFVLKLRRHYYIDCQFN